MRGRFITLEGGEGVGKSTNMAFIEEWLKQRGVEYLKTREPGGTVLGEALRDLLLHQEQVEAKAELLMVFAARAQHIETLIRPALEAGRWVVSDRFTDASYAYQGGGRLIEQETIEFLEAFVQGTLRPDLTLLLDVPVEIGMHRVEVRGAMDRFELEQVSFFERVRSAYLQRALKEPERIRIVSADRPLSEVQRTLAGHLESLLT
jgi:dTMP kinase